MSVQDVIEQFRGLTIDGNGLLKRLLQFKNTMDDANQRPSVLEKQYEKVVSKLISKFPEVVPADRVVGFEVLTSNAKQVLTEFSSSYFALVDSYDWMKKTKDLLCDSAGKLTVVSLKESPATMANFFTLLQMFGQVCVFVGKLPEYEKRATLAVYSRVLYHQTKQEEPLFKGAAQWVAEMADPFAYVGQALQPCAALVGQSLRELGMSITDISATRKLRDDSSLNIVGKPNEMQVVTDDLLRFELVNAERVRVWTFYASLVAAPALRDDETLFASTLGALLNENMVAHLAGGETWNVHEAFERVWDAFKSKDKKAAKVIAKEKRAIRDGLAQSATAGWASHEERRLFLSQELQGLVAMARDTPALIPFKLNVMLGALAMAREEIFWYFRHIERAPALYARKDWTDVRITELMYHQRTLEDTIFLQSENISHFYAQMIAVADTAAAATAAADIAAVGGEAAAIANEIASILQGFGGNAEAVFADNAEQAEHVHNLYDSLDYAMACSPDCGQHVEALVTMHAIARHAEFVYGLDVVLDRNSSLLNLWYYDRPVRAAFESHMTGERFEIGSPYCSTYLSLLSDFPRTSNEFWPEERELIGHRCVEEAESYCAALAQRVRMQMNVIIRFAQVFSGHLSERHALVLYQAVRPDFRPPKDYVKPSEPSFESQYENRGMLRELRLATRDMSQIVHSLAVLDSVVVYDSRFTPLEYVREVVQNILRNWFRSMLQPNPKGVIRRPSDVYRRLDSVLQALSRVEHFATLGIEAAWREVVLEEFFVGDFCRFGTSEATPLLEINSGEIAVTGVIHWYQNFLTRTIPNSLGNIVYSPIHKAFVTRTNAPAQLALPMAESMCSVSELRALVALMGPYGTKIFDALILRLVANYTDTMKGLMAANMPVLEEIAQTYSIESRFVEATKKLRDVDAFVQNAVQIGVMLTFRQMLKEALGAVVSDTTPYISSSIGTLFNTYPRNVHPEPALLALDLLAADYGVDVGEADQSLKGVLKTVMANDNPKMWALLPVMFGVMFLCPTWRSAHYISSLDAYHGNLHLLARVVNDFVIGFSSLISQPEDDTVTTSLNQFVEVASMTLLRQARIPLKGDKKPDWAAITIFVDQFVDSCPLVTRDVLEESIPYTLLRSLIRDIYTTRSTDGW